MPGHTRVFRLNPYSLHSVSWARDKDTGHLRAIFTDFQNESVLLVTSHFLYSERTVNSYDEGHLKIGFNLIIHEDVGEFTWASDGDGTWNSPGRGPH